MLHGVHHSVFSDDPVVLLGVKEQFMRNIQTMSIGSPQRTRGAVILILVL